MIIYHLVKRHEGLLRIFRCETSAMFCQFGSLAVMRMGDVERWWLVEIDHITMSRVNRNFRLNLRAVICRNERSRVGLNLKIYQILYLLFLSFSLIFLFAFPHWLFFDLLLCVVGPPLI